MDCNEIQPNLMDYNLGRLTRSESELIGAHLLTCEDCAAVLEEERTLSLRFGAISAVQPQNDVWALIRSRTHPRSTVFGLLRARVVKITAAAAAVAAVAIAIVSMQPNNQPNNVDKESVHAVTAIMLQSEKTPDDPLGSNADALAAAIDEGT